MGVRLPRRALRPGINRPSPTIVTEGRDDDQGYSARPGDASTSIDGPCPSSALRNFGLGADGDRAAGHGSAWRRIGPSAGLSAPLGLSGGEPSGARGSFVGFGGFAAGSEDRKSSLRTATARLRGGSDHREDAGPDRSGEGRPGGDDFGQISRIGIGHGSTGGSTQGTDRGGSSRLLAGRRADLFGLSLTQVVQRDGF